MLAEDFFSRLARLSQDCVYDITLISICFFSEPHSKKVITTFYIANTVFLPIKMIFKFEIRRSEDQPWGFHVTEGSDSEQRFKVLKVRKIYVCIYIK